MSVAETTSMDNPQPEQEPQQEPLSETAAEPCSSGSQPGTDAAENAKKRRRKKHYHKVFEPGNSKSLRRIKRLGYTPEVNKRGYKADPEPEAPRFPYRPVVVRRPNMKEDDSAAAVEVTAEYPYGPNVVRWPKTAEDRVGGAPKRKKVFYSYTKVNGKSARYLHETPEEQAARRAKYKERNRRYTEKETEEQHRHRLERRRLRRIADRQKAGQAVAVRRRRLTAAEADGGPPKEARIVTVGGEEGRRLEELQKEYVEFNRYVSEKLQETAGTRNRQMEIAYWQHDPEQIELPAENVHNAAAAGFLSPAITNGYHDAVQKPPSAVLYSNHPVDPEIALLETSDETFVPVQVIIQTCDDFDDMLEIDENP